MYPDWLEARKSNEDMTDMIVASIYSSRLLNLDRPDSRGQTPAVFNGKPIHEFTYHLGSESQKESATWRTISEISRSAVTDDPHISLLSQCSGSGKTHATYLLGRASGAGIHPVLAVLCNVYNKDDSTSLTEPWAYTQERCNKLIELAVRCRRDSEERKEIARAAFALVKLTFVCYLEYIGETLKNVKKYFLDSQIALDTIAKALRLSALLALRNGKGESAVAEIMKEYISEQRVLGVNESVLYDFYSGGTAYRIPNETTITTLFDNAHDALLRMLNDDITIFPGRTVTIMFCIDEIQAAAGRCPNLFIFNSELEGQRREASSVYRDEPDLVYGIYNVCRHILGKQCGSVLLGTRASFSNLERWSTVSRTKVLLRQYHDLDVFDVKKVRELVSVYHPSLANAFADLWENPYQKSFRENINDLVGRPKWAKKLVTLLVWHDSTRSLQDLAKKASDAVKEELRGIAREAFRSVKLVPGSSHTPQGKAMVNLLLTILLDRESVPLTESVLDAIVMTGVIGRRGQKLASAEEPLVGSIVRELGVSQLQCDRPFAEEAMKVGKELLLDDNFLQAAGLGEKFEPLFAHWILLRCFENRDDCNLWSVFSPMLDYVKEAADDPNHRHLRRNAEYMIERLKDIKLDITECVRGGLGRDENGADFWRLFEEHSSGHFIPLLNRLLYDLSRFAGTDFFVLARDTKARTQSSQVCSVSMQSKIEIEGDLQSAALTTDPNLQYLTKAARTEVLAGKAIPRGAALSGRSSFEQLRQRLTVDPFAKCIRLVVALMQKEALPDTYRICIENFATCMKNFSGTGTSPLVVLNVKAALPEILEKKELMSKQKVKGMSPLHRGSPIWKFLQTVQFSSKSARTKL